MLVTNAPFKEYVETWLLYSSVLCVSPFVVTGVGVVGVLLTAVAFFSLQPLEFFGLKEPLEQLLGTRYMNINNNHYPHDCCAC